MLCHLSFALLVARASALCDLCLNAGPPGNPEAIIGNVSCQELYESSTFYELLPNSPACLEAQSADKQAVCGCNTNNYKGCSICSNGSSVGTPDLSFDSPLFDLAGYGVMTGETCGSLNAALRSYSADSDTCHGFHKSTATDYLCGCPGALKQCSVCPDGSPVGIPDYEFLVLEQNFTCRELDDVIPFFGQDNCPTNAYLSLQCGCPGVKQNCTLCEDGTASFDPTFQVISGGDCQAIQEVSSFVSLDECRAVQGTFGAYCSCSNNISSSSACRLCGTLLPDPSLMLIDDFGNSTSCAVLEYAATLDNNCTNAQALYTEACCSTGTSSTPSAGPIPALGTSSLSLPPVPSTPPSSNVMGVDALTAIIIVGFALML